MSLLGDDVNRRLKLIQFKDMTAFCHVVYYNVSTNVQTREIHHFIHGSDETKKRKKLDSYSIYCFSVSYDKREYLDLWTFENGKLFTRNLIYFLFPVCDCILLTCQKDHFNDKHFCIIVKRICQ